MKLLRIATRKSPLALWQANHVKNILQKNNPKLHIELISMQTIADKMLATPLTKIGGKGLFVKELETAILEHRADIAVHSLKDMPPVLPKGLELATICKREDPRDVFVSHLTDSVLSLPQNARVGTSSLRRKAQLLALRSDINIVDLRGNVGTRLQKLGDREFDAIILAAAGLIRLNLSSRIASYFDINTLLPAAGQGAIGIECRSGDNKVLSLLASLNDHDTQQCVLAERTVTDALGGGCQLPIAAYACLCEGELFLKALVSNTTGSIILRASKKDKIDNANEIGRTVAEDLINQGAKKLLDEILRTTS